jgi:predicted secreted protein
MKNAAFSLLILSALCASCSGSPASQASQNAGPQTFTVELAGNPTTGYSWTWTASPEGAVREISSDYRRDSGAEGRVGAGGTFVFTFEKLLPGAVTLSFAYARPWEQGAAPAETAEFTVTDGPLVKAK